MSGNVVRHSPAFFCSAVAVLGLGLAAGVLAFAVGDALLLAPVMYRDPGSLVQLRERDPQGNLAPLTAAEFRVAQRQSGWTAAPAAIDLGMFQLTGVPEPEEFAGAAITPNTLATLGVAPLFGHDLAVAQSDEVLLSYRAWTRRFGADPNIVGRAIHLDWQRTPVREQYRVAGVLPPRFWLVYRGVEVFVPLTDTILGGGAQRRRYYAIARRAVPRDDALPLADAGRQLAISPLLRDLTGEARPAALSLAVAAGLFVLLACANVSSLFLARGLRRRTEFAIRVAIGAGRWDLTRLVAGEALLVAAVAALIAVPLAHVGLQLLQRYLPAESGWAQFTPGIDAIAVDGRALAFAAIAALLCALAASILPVLQTSKVSDSLRGSAGRQRSRQVLIGVEVAIATVLLCGAALLFRSSAMLDSADLGFARGPILVARAPRIGRPPDPAYYDDLRRRLEAIPGVGAVTFASYQPLTNTRPERRFTLVEGGEASASYCVVAADFFDAYGARLLAGRGFSAADTFAAPPVVVVNEEFARRNFSGGSPLGARVQIAGDAAPSEIVGVVSGIRQSLRAPAPPTIYRASAQDPRATLQVGIRTLVPPLSIAAAVRHEIGAAGGAAAELSTLDQFVLGESWNVRLTGTLVLVFSAVALGIAAFGIFSVVAYLVGQRTREIGIRMALGARAFDIGAMLLAGGLRPIIGGLTVGLAAAFGLRRMLESLLFGVRPDDPASYAAAAAVLLVGAIAALAIPMRRAARLRPIDALRHE